MWMEFGEQAHLGGLPKRGDDYLGYISSEEV